MMARAVRHRCDVPGCTRGRARWMRLCSICFDALPGDIRSGIIDAKRRGASAEWRQQCRRAAEHLKEGIRPIAAHATVSPERAAELQARLLGERIDP